MQRIFGQVIGQKLLTCPFLGIFFSVRAQETFIFRLVIIHRSYHSYFSVFWSTVNSRVFSKFSVLITDSHLAGIRLGLDGDWTVRDCTRNGQLTFEVFILFNINNTHNALSPVIVLLSVFLSFHTTV